METSPAPEPIESAEQRTRSAARTLVQRLRSRRWGVPAIVLAILAIAGVLFIRDVLALRGSLERAADELEAARAAVIDTDIDAATMHVAAARADVDATSNRSDGPMWGLVRLLPVIGDSGEAVDAAIELASTSVAVAETALSDGGDLLPTDGTLPISFENGQLDLEGLADYGELIDTLPLAAVEDARDRLAAAAEGIIPGILRRAADEAVVAANDVLATVAAGRDGLDLLEGMLGADGPRTILIGVQNPGELRGTGGLLGFLAILRTEDGRITLEEPIGLDPRAVAEAAILAIEGSAGAEGEGVVHHTNLQRLDNFDDPAPRPPDFAERYDRVNGGAALTAVNLYPDVPVVGGVLSGLYDKLAGVEVDAVVFVDPLALQHIQSAVGPLDVPDELSAQAPMLPDPIPAEDLAKLLMIDVYDELGGPTDLRRNYQATIADEAFSALWEGTWEPADMARAIGETLAGRHIQVWSSVPAEQEAIERLGVSGSLDDDDPLTDDLLITASNSAANKGDSFAAHEFSVGIRLSQPNGLTTQRLAVVEIDVANHFGEELHDPYIEGSLQNLPNGPSVRDPRRGVMRTWWTWWVDPGASVQRFWVGNPAEQQRFNDDEIGGLRAIDAIVEYLPGETKSLGMDWRSPVELEQDGDELVYRFRWRRQPKPIHDQLTVRLEPPRGWYVTSATASTGPALPALDGLEFAPPTAIVEDGGVTMKGTVTGDVLLEVRMTR